MDLLEYQGKQLFARHGVPVPSGSPATTVEEAVAAADEIGYPCVIKAQVQIGGRGKAGGIKVAQGRAEAEEHAKAILGMDIRGHTVHEVWVEAASDIASEYYASIVFDRTVKLDGTCGILGNGAGLVMSTLDVVAQAGGKPANFLDAGGGSKAEAITQAVEVILSDEKVTAVLFNIFGGITRCDEVARGLIEAFDQIKPEVPFVVRLDGTNDEEGRRLLAEADLPNVHTEATMLDAARRVVELAG